MTRFSNHKINRLFRRDEKTGEITRREVPIEEPLYKAGDCYLCNLPVTATNGQFLKWVEGPNDAHLYSHKKCRKEKEKRDRENRKDIIKFRS